MHGYFGGFEGEPVRNCDAKRVKIYGVSNHKTFVMLIYWSTYLFFIARQAAIQAHRSLAAAK